MAQQTIAIGTVANDGTGDDLRTAGGKINSNFDELYAASAANAETIDDRVAALLVAGTNITLTYDDGGNSLTIDAATPTTGDITGFNEAVDDRVAALVIAGTGITKTYDDTAGTLTIASTAGGLSQVIPTTQSGTTYTAELTDAPASQNYQGYIEFTNASAVAFTIPPNGSVAFPIGTVIAIEQAGAGTVTLTPGSEVTLNSRGGLLDTAGQYAVVQVKKKATDTWTVIGDVA